MNNEIFKMEFITIGQEVNLDKQMIYKKSKREKGTLNRAEYEQKNVIWNLRKYDGKIEYDGIEYKYQSSSMELNKQLTSTRIVEELNLKNLFDFEYLPEENDFLVLKSEYKYKQNKTRSRPFINYYISFIFKDGKWNINNGYDHIFNKYIDFKYGIIKYVS